MDSLPGTAQVKRIRRVNLPIGDLLLTCAIINQINKLYESI